VTVDPDVPKVLYHLAGSAIEGSMSPVPSELVAIPVGCALEQLGIELTHIGRGRARGEMAIQERHLNQHGSAQGGVVVALADAVAGWACDAVVTPGSSYITAELKCNLLRAAPLKSTLVAIAEAVHAGRRTVVIVCRVFRAEHEGQQPEALVAHFSCTQLVGPAT
jgi:uncharacterized protein (TIGR00369 family)